MNNDRIECVHRINNAYRILFHDSLKHNFKNKCRNTRLFHQNIKRCVLQFQLHHTYRSIIVITYTFLQYESKSCI